MMRQNSDLITLEGRLVIARALALPHWRVRRLLTTDTALQALRPALDAAPADRRPAIEVLTRDELTATAGFSFHQGCFACADRPARLDWRELDLGRLVVVLEDVKDPDNVGSIFRTALAFGVSAMLLGPGCADPLYRKAIRTSMAATLSLPFAEAAPWPAMLDQLRARGFRLLATTPRVDAMTVANAAHDLGREPPIALLVGSEGPGLSDEVLKRVDHHVRIPIATNVDSLNVATATAIALYELTR